MATEGAGTEEKPPDFPFPTIGISCEESETILEGKIPEHGLDY